MPNKSPRIAVRAVIIKDAKLLLVNAWPEGRSNLMCAPGGGVEPGASLPDNLAREVHEETGLKVCVGAPCLVNEFHDAKSGFHQVEIFFRCKLTDEGRIDPSWQDPERIVSRHIWASREDYAKLLVKPDALEKVAFESASGVSYDPLEPVVV